MVYIISYGGAAVPGLVIGSVFGTHSLLSIVSEYCTLIAIVWCFVVFLTRKKKETVMSAEENRLLED